MLRSRLGRGGKAGRLALAGPPLLTVFGLPIELLGLTGRSPLIRHLQHFDFESLGGLSNDHLLTRFDGPGGFGPHALYLHMATPDGIDGQAAGFEEPGRP